MSACRVLVFFIAIFAISAANPAQQSSPRSPQLPMTHMSGLLRLTETIPLPTEGYMDHLAADVRGSRLFIAGSGSALRQDDPRD